MRLERRKMISATHTAMATVATVPQTPVFASAQARAPTMPAAGKVTSQAINIRPATPQLTGLPFLPKTGADDGPGANLRSRKREAEVRGNQNGGCTCSLGGKALRGADLGQALAQGADDAPPAQCTVPAAT